MKLFTSSVSFSNTAVDLALVATSVAMGLTSLIAVPMFLVRMPDDYLARPPGPRTKGQRVARFALGTVLIALGVALTVLPGQGLMTVLLGLYFVELPFTNRCLRWLLARPKVRRAVDALRHKAGKSPLIVTVDSHAMNPRPEI